MATVQCPLNDKCSWLSPGARDGAEDGRSSSVHHRGQMKGMDSEIHACTQQEEGVCISALNGGLRFKTSRFWTFQEDGEFVFTL